MAKLVYVCPPPKKSCKKALNLSLPENFMRWAKKCKEIFSVVSTQPKSVTEDANREKKWSNWHQNLWLYGWGREFPWSPKWDQKSWKLGLFFFQIWIFLVACTRLYQTLCWSIGWSVLSNFWLRILLFQGLQRLITAPAQPHVTEIAVYTALFVDLLL